jgi:hypothetical protein
MQTKLNGERFFQKLCRNVHLLMPRRRIVVF